MPAPIVTVDVAFAVTCTVELGAAVVVVPLVLATPAVPVTLAVRFVVSVTDAVPAASLVAAEELSDPASVVNATGIPARALPPASATLAVIVDEPPLADTTDGLAFITTLATAAAPMAILRMLPVVTEPEVVGAEVTPPDIAEMLAVPDVVPARNLTVARPAISVSASAG